MKALTLDSAWAMEVFEGKKTVECRTWKTDYRGDLLICSNSKRRVGCIPGHALIVAELVDIVPFTEEHLAAAGMDEMPDKPCYAWILDNFATIQPFKVKGQLHLFDVDDDLIEYLDDENVSDDEIDEWLNNEIAPLICGYTAAPAQQ